MNKNKTNSILYYICSVLWYLAAILKFATGNNNSLGFVYICLGSSFLCLGSMHVKEAKDNNDDDNKNN